MIPIEFDIVMKREYKKWKAKYYSAKSQSNYDKMEKCHSKMMECLAKANQNQNK